MNTLHKTIFSLFTVVVAMHGVLPQSAFAHCQIPCGIYNDNARIQMLLEDATTVEKSVASIIELSGKTDAQSLNQLVRWVENKELHAQKIITTISDYFLTQRVKPDQKDYTERLIKHHAVILAAMGVKQNADTEHVSVLKKSIESLLLYYPEHNHLPKTQVPPAKKR